MVRVIWLFVTCLPLVLRAQSQWEISGGGSIDMLPDAFTSQCGRSLAGMPGLGAQINIRRSLASRFFIEGVATGVLGAAGGCTADLPIVQLDDSTFEGRPGYRFDGVPTERVVATLSRAGVTHRLGPVEAALVVGVGGAWSANPVALTSTAVALGFGRGSKRVRLELDRSIAWLEGTETRYRYRRPGSEDGSYVHRSRLRAPWWSLRVGYTIMSGR